MGTDTTKNIESIKSERAIDKFAQLEALPCPACGNSFIPKTSKQQFCDLNCQVTMRKTRGVPGKALLM